MKTEKTRCLPVSAWPSADRAAWEAAQQANDPFSLNENPCAHWRSSTRDVTAAGYGRFLTWLADEGKLDARQPAASRANEANLLAYLAALQQSDSPFSVVARLQQLGNALRIIAPSSNYAAVLRASSRLRVKAAPVRDKKSRLQPVDRLASLGIELIEKGIIDTVLTPVVRAKLVRDGLIIALLAYRGYRRANLTSIEIGQQLTQREGVWHLAFAEDSVKSGRPLEERVPKELEQYLARYIGQFRPILLACSKKGRLPTNALWISSHGTVMTGGAIALQVKARTQAAFGASITPHFFRDAIATTTAIATPDRAGDTAALLGHSSPEIAEKHYNQAKGVEARRQHADLVGARQRSARKAKAA